MTKNGKQYYTRKAAKATGKSDTTIRDAIRTGRIPSAKKTRSGWQMLAAEVHSLLGQKPTAHKERGTEENDAMPSTDDRSAWIAELRQDLTRAQELNQELAGIITSLTRRRR